ncbi:uncharacterized protein LACBIDRAFT_317977 [Laccaria bicolor S238N-H82]|uniref:Predicted protein n=1 Tax=Laccaria bicolor (strain S238N-H82 / ATCC MYA-4686) TaxID=486041 RepID=B0D5N2_LACBS|nr:uncharacterized protein LACBIDRAFT_317977 [Laccaria bicolor S238N-H82]EDR10046.1 predicted protein [Laccaria bicolor S238N-H82]|eukprot:XP_001879431.1 predicted protein [Laccaria bicolor S238N-H82]
MCPLLVMYMYVQSHSTHDSHSPPSSTIHRTCFPTRCCYLHCDTYYSWCLTHSLSTVFLFGILIRR